MNNHEKREDRKGGRIREWLPWSILVAATIAVLALTTVKVVWPSYQDRQSRLYTSRLGYVAMMRNMQRPLLVTVSQPRFRSMSEQFVGEGFIRSNPILVPIVPVGRIGTVHVKAGQSVKAGELLVEMDATEANLRLEAARVNLEIAEAELQRTKIGSSYLLEKERPEREVVRLESAEDQMAIRKELDQMYESLIEDKAISRAQALRQKIKTVETLAELRTAQISLEQSQRGREQSILIALASVRDAELALKQREFELTNFRIVAPADGIIERCMVNAGEFNQNPGKPAFLLASGRWFEAYFDQTVVGKIEAGDKVQVILEAFPGQEISGTASAIHPFISFNSGGPETIRPIRPSGTGSPEWPATFSVRIELGSTDVPAVGLSGLARVMRTREVLAVPSDAFVAKTATEGVVLVANGQRFERRTVTLGAVSQGWTEIRGGLDESEHVIIEGQHDIQDGDSLEINSDGGRLLANQEEHLPCDAF